MRHNLKIVALLSVLFVVLFSGCNTLDKQQNPKYVFYFIGDGMGIQQINTAQAFLDSDQNLWEDTKLVFSEFPVAGYSTTTAHNRYITGSAAAGTALASGFKTSINTLGLNHDHTDSLFSVAYYAKKHGYNVGVATNVSIDHATPGAFYAHQPTRRLYHEIAHDLINSGYEYFGSGGFIDPLGDESENPRGDAYAVGSEKGVYFTTDLTLDDSIKSAYQTIVFSAPNPASGASLKSRIDNLEGDEVILKNIVEQGIEVLKNDNGFFFMVEGGKIDWGCHDNDAALVVHEVIDFSEAIQVAIDFYNQYPNETLIVITADHETGGMALGNREMRYESDVSLLAHQKVSGDALRTKVEEYLTANPKPTIKQVQEFIFSDSIISVPIAEFTEYELKEFNDVVKRALLLENGYRKYSMISSAAIDMLNHRAGIGWTSGSHTASPVPVYALGVGQDKFSGSMDNVDIPRRIAELMGFTIE